MKNIYNKKTCFISYPFGNANIEHMIRNAVSPALDDAGWKIIDPRYAEPMAIPIFDWIVTNLREADLFICDITDKNPNVIYEMGLAHAWGIPSIILSEEIENVPFDISSKYAVFIYSRYVPILEHLRRRVYEFIIDLQNKPYTLLSPNIKRYIDPKASISIEILSKKLNAITALRFLYKLIDTLNCINSLEPNILSEVRIGSFGAWISSNLKNLTDLAEKIIFFVPEWKKRNAERIKIEAEAEYIIAQTEKIRAESHEIKNESRRKDINQLIEIIRSSKEIGPMRLSIGNKIKIETDENGQTIIGIPKGF